MENQKDTTFGNTESSDKQFRIEVATEGQGGFYYVRPLGELRYEILDDQGSIGTILLDGNDHARCESVGCELDLPLMHAIRKGIQTHEDWHHRA